MVGQPQCLSNFAATCLDAETISYLVVGYCSYDVCFPCPAGTFGTDDKKCNPCSFATWQPELGQTKCGSSFTYETALTIKSYIPYGGTKIIVKVRDGGGSSDSTTDIDYVGHSSGSGGFSSCNKTVPRSNPLYVIIAGGGGANFPVDNSGGTLALLNYLLIFVL